MTQVTVRQASLVAALAALVLVLRFPPPTEWLQEEELFAATGGITWHGLAHIIPAIAFHSGLHPYLFMVGTVAAVAGIIAARLSWLAGLALALLPFSIYVTVLNAHWFTGILLALLLVMPRSRWDPLLAVVCALNGFAAVILAPLYLWRARQHPVLSAVVLAGAAFQLVMLATGDRPHNGVAVLDGLAASVVRLGMAPLGDFPIIGWLWLVTIPAFVLAARYLPRPLVLVLTYYSVTTAVLGILTSTTPDRLWLGWAEARYFVAASWTMWLAYGAAITDGFSALRVRQLAPTSSGNSRPRPAT